MRDRRRRQEEPHRDPTEGVRLIGEDEAAQALERDDVRRRRREGEPRYGDRPAPPPGDGPRPALRFPLDSYDDPTTIERPPVVPVKPRTEAPELSHWAGSAAEEVPHMNRRPPSEGDDSAWATFAGSDPRWRDDPAEPPRARPTRPGWPPDPVPDAGGQAPGRGAPAGFEGDPGDPAPGRSIFGDEPGPGRDSPVNGASGYAAPTAYDDTYDPDGYATDPYGDDVYGDQAYGDDYGTGYGDAYDDPYGGHGEAGFFAGGPGGAVAAPRRVRSGRSSDRDLRTAVGVGVAFAATALALFWVGGPVGAMAVAVAVLGYATYEWFVAAHESGFQPLLPVGVVATVGTVLAAYNYGEHAIPLALVLAVAVCFLWYIVGAGGERPVANIGVSLIGICWVGIFGSFAALLLSAPNGVALLLAAVVPTVGYDVGALFVGRSAGSRPLSDASPNKTIEGLAGGMLLAVVAGVVFSLAGVTPFDTWQEGLQVGVLVALVAPLGDLSESKLKRDLGLKDMGTVLPGHGGMLDRFDGLLFVLPAMWYLSRVSDFFLG
ncbi:MAG: phosphatidate cytidylyltransferase [Acidimicrobiia bacterium]